MEIKLADYHFIEVGILGRTKGIKGFIYCHFKEQFQELADEVEYVFLFDGGNPYPLKIFERKFQNGLLIKLSDSYSIEELRHLSDSLIYINKTDIPEELLTDSLTGLYHHLKGYTFHDTTSGKSGNIIDIQEYPLQIMVVAELNGEEFLFPIHEELIDAVDEKAGLISLNLPDGIFSLNT